MIDPTNLTNGAKVRLPMAAVMLCLIATPSIQAQSRSGGIVVQVKSNGVGVPSRIVVQNVSVQQNDVRTLPSGIFAFDSLRCSSNLKFNVIPLDRAAYRGRLAQPNCDSLANRPFVVEVEGIRR